MRRGRCFVIVAGCVLLGTMGCRTPKQEASPAFAAANLPVVARQLAMPDVSRALDETADPIHTTVEPYHWLTAEEVRVLACSRAAAASLIEAMAAEPPSTFPVIKSHTSADKLRRITATNLANEARLRTAGAALDLYFRLQEAELLTDVLTLSQVEVDRLVESGKVMADKGFTESADYLKLRQQQIELRADRAKLQNGIHRLNLELKALLALDTTSGRLLPSDAIRIDSENLDADRAVQIAIAQRPDLQTIRDLANRLDQRSVDAVRQTFAGLVPPLGAVTAASKVFAPGLRLFFPALASGDVEGLRRQLRMHLAEREREAAKDVRSTVAEWHLQRDLVAIARQRQAIEVENVRELTVKKEKGASVEVEYRRALIAKLTADAAVIREAVKWKQLDVRARREMGLLCGGTGTGCDSCK